MAATFPVHVVYRFLSVACPSTSEPACASGCFDWREHLYAPVWTLAVVERNGCFHGFPDVLDAAKRHVLEKLILQRVVDAFGFRIVLGIA